jgi:ABC-2 type transport system permease protein
VTRLRWYLSFVIMGIVASGVILVLAGLLMGSALAGVERGLVGPAIALSIAQLPAVALYLAVTAVVFGLFPRATSPVGWTVFGLGVVLGEFGALLGLPEWVRKIAPTDHTLTVPLGNADWTGTWVMSILALVLLGVGARAFARRAIVPTS